MKPSEQNISVAPDDAEDDLYKRCLSAATRPHMIGWEMTEQRKQWNLAPKQKSCDI